MAVAEMSKLRLIGLLDEKDLLLNSLQKTGAVQITATRQTDGTESPESKAYELALNNLDELNLALSIIEKAVYDSGDKEIKNAMVGDGFTVDSAEFSTALSKSKEILEVSNEVIQLNTKINDIKAENINLLAEISSYEPYILVKEKFSTFKSSNLVTIKLGSILNSVKDKLFLAVENLDGVECYEIAESVGGQVVVAVLNYKNDGEITEILSSVAFNECSFTGDYTASEKVASLKSVVLENEREILCLQKSILNSVSSVRDMKLLADRYSFEIEKVSESDKFKVTNKTFIMEAFVPTKKQEKVENAVKRTTENYYLQYEAVTEEDLPPTYLENGKIASNFEFVTNMYSVPKYGALDPNGVMGFFFSLFMGIIVADAGYGLMMAVACYLFSKKMANSVTMQRLSNILMIGGLFAIPFGVLFDSFLGFQIIHKICEINGGANNAYALFYTENLDAIQSFSSLAGISIPTMLLWSLLFGVIHLAAGYVVKAVHDFKNKRFLDGFIDGICWAIFLIGLAIFAYSMIEGISEVAFSVAQTLGIVLLAIGLGVAVIFAGRNNKGFGKITGSFGSLYGVINILSDILSYARLYGLMLSGSQVASIFTNTIAVNMLFPLGPIGIIFGIVVILIGNVFNLAMGVLGAYIHDSRLQYVEFFGKFYEGDGELFTPLGSTFAHVVYSCDEN